jgi:hypothetical protein
MLAVFKSREDTRVDRADGTEDRLAALGRSLFESTGSNGVHGRTALFETVIEALSALITQHREPDTEVLRFPPVMSRRHVEKAGYLHGFPHLLGCVCGLQGDEAEIHAAVGRFNGGQDWTDALRATDLVLTPAACYPLYPLAAARGAVPARALEFDVESYCFRREATHEIDRSSPSACANSYAWARRGRRSTSAAAGWRAPRRWLTTSRCRFALPPRATRSSAAPPG